LINEIIRQENISVISSKTQAHLD